MHKLMISAATVALALGLGGVAYADCTIDNERTYSNEDRAVRSTQVRRDLRQLRSAASILKQYQKTEACNDVVAAIQDIRKNPMKGMKSDDAKEVDTTSWQDRSKKRMASAKPITELGGRLRLEELMDADVVGSNGDTVGEIEDVVMADTGKPAYVVLGFGGFLGMGEEQAAVPFSQLRVAVDEDGDKTYFIAMTEEQLKKAPKFKRGDETWFDNQDWRKTNDAYYAG